jgi:hypothetical protein
MASRQPFIVPSSMTRKSKTTGNRLGMTLSITRE